MNYLHKILTIVLIGGLGPLSAGGNAALAEDAAPGVDEAEAAPSLADYALSEDNDQRFWSSLHVAYNENTDISGDSHGTTITGMIGYDQWVTPKLLVGGIISREQSKIKSGFTAGERDGTGISFTPYAGYSLTDWLILDGSAGYTWQEFDILSLGNTGDANGNRWMAGSNLTAIYPHGNFVFRGSVGYLASNSLTGAYTDSSGARIEETSSHVGQVSTTLSAGYYQIFDGFIASADASIRYEDDLVGPESSLVGDNRLSTVDPNGIVLRLGGDLNFKNNFGFAIAASTTEMRENTNSYSLNTTVSYKF